MNALTFLKVKYGAEPEFRKVCERLLEDPARPIRIEAAIPLAEAAIVANPGEPRLALTLLPAFEEKSIREEYVELNSYTYNQYPPGSSSRPVRKIPGIATRVEQAEWLKRRIEVALIRLEPFLTPEQLARFTSDRKQTSNR